MTTKINQLKPPKKIKIGIDASCILPRKTGVGKFSLSLLREMLSLESPFEFILFLNSFRHSKIDLPLAGMQNIKIKQYRLPGPLLVQSWRYLRFPPIDLLTGFVDAFHSLSGYIPPQIHGKKIVSVYDLFFMRHTEQCDVLGGQYFASVFPKQLPQCEHIICPSNSTKKDLIELLKIPTDSISVIYGGVDQRKFHIITDYPLLEMIRKEYCLPPRYILGVSTLEMRKNLDGLFIAYKHLKEKLYNPPKLVLVGGEGWKSTEIKSAVKQHRLISDVIFTGYIPEEHLPLIYNSALFFVFPSLWEGFGLPVLEAMACGVPCLISDIPALHEIAEEAALFADPYNYYEMAERMKDLITSHTLRETLQQKGLAQVNKFSWRLTAQKTLRVYEKILKT
ncbi:MAG: Mannosylfructose-phosphate synthase [candidate division BRC1 bacterium ADurb.Bin183]|nr:MAG: Mannosylfructose-phosphate synthase [candidate division BRC1 bacterium ADurb.Bin183]